MASRDPFEEFKLPTSPSVAPTQPRVAAPPQTDPFADLEVPSFDPLAEFEANVDVGANEAGFVDRLQSAGANLLKGLVDPLASQPAAAGDAYKIGTDYATWSNLPPEERRKESVSTAVGSALSFVSNLNPIWWLAKQLGPEDATFMGTPVNEIAEKTGENVGRSTAEMVYRVDQLAKEHTVPGFWSQDLPHAVGTTSSIAAMSAAVSVASEGTIPPWAVAGWLGASLGAEEGINDAAANGATPEQAAIAGGIGYLLGTTEALPIIRMLDRADNATGGIFSRKINQVFQQKLVGSILKEGLKGAVEEGLQEMLQQGGQDFAAKLMYDPTRAIGSRMLDAAESGGGSGFILSAVATALGIPLRMRQQQRARDTFLRTEVERITGSPITPSMEAAIQRDAPFSPLAPAYFEVQQGIQTTLARMEQMGKMQAENRTLSTGEMRDLLNGRTIGHDFRQGVISPTDFIHDIQSDTTINREVETGLPANVPAGATDEYGVTEMRPLSTMEALEKQPVVVTGFEQFKTLYENWKTEHDRLPAGPEKDHAAIQVREYKKFYTAEVQLAKELKSLIAKLRPMYFSKDSKIVLSGGEFSGHSLGAMWSSSDGKMMRIGVNFEKIISMGGYVSHPGDTSHIAEAVARAKEVALHEVGHGIVNQAFTELTARVQAATWTKSDIQDVLDNAKTHPQEKLHLERVRTMQDEAAKTGKSPASNRDVIAYNAVMNEYRVWLERRMKSAFVNRFRDVTSPSMLYYWNKRLSGKREGQHILETSNDPSYFYNFDEFMAENFARVATQHSWATEAAKKFFEQQRASLEKFYGAAHAQQPTLSNFTDWIKLMSLEGKLEAIIKRAAKENLSRYDFLRNPAKAKELGLDPTAFKDFDFNMDNYQRWYKAGLNILQLGRLNPHIEPLQRYIRLVRTFNNKIGSFRWRGHNTLKQWRGLGGEQASNVSTAMLEETIKGEFLTDEQLRRDYKLNDDAIALFKQVKTDFNDVLNRMEKVLLGEVRQNLYNNPVELNAEVKRVQEEMAKLRKKPFFPLIRYGRHSVRVTEKKTGKVLEFQTFETRRERARALAEIRSRYDDKAVIGQGYLTDAEMAVQGMQGPMLRELRKKLEQAGNLTDDMRQAMDSMLKDTLPIESFRRHFVRRRKIKGYSEDATRSYATYMMQAATHLARIEMQSDMNNAINNIGKDSREMAKLGKDGTKRGQIAEMTREHFNYMLNPTNDWPMLRSAGFVWFLGFNVKSAFVNSTQMFLGTHPYLSARFGDVAATKALAGAVSDYTKYWSGFKNKLSQGQLALLAKGKADGWLDESLATELAIARSSSLNASLPVSSGKRIWAKFAEISALPFHTVEKMNRGLTALATFDLAQKAGLNQAQSIALAREAVDATQFEYARWARPKFMQGKLGSNVFLFKNYMQNMLFLSMGNDPAAGRVLFALLTLAGFMGLPFAEDLLDILDVVGTKLKRSLGWKDPKVQSRQMVREMLLEMQMNPDLFMYGLGESSMGLGYLGDLTGFPIPEVDLQGSLSMGNIIPGTAALKRLQEGDSDQAFLDFIEEVGGAEAGVMGDLAAGVLSDQPDSWRKWETSLPSALRQLSRAGRYAVRGEETSQRGEPIAEFDPTDMQDKFELAAQLIGFTPSKVSRGWEAYIAERELTAYYEAWRRATLRNHNYARLYEDGEAIKATMTAIRDYNKQVPYPEMRLSAETINRSLQEFARQRAEAGKSVPAQRQYIRLSREIRELYEE